MSGDIVSIQEGDIVPADIRLVEAVNLNINESVLTGESTPVKKQTTALPCEDTSNIALGDRTNMAFRATTVIQGRGVGIVVGTGVNSQLGDTVKSINETIISSLNNKTPIQRSMSRLLLVLFILGLVFAFVVIAVNDFVLEDYVVIYAVAVLVSHSFCSRMFTHFFFQFMYWK